MFKTKEEREKVLNEQVHALQVQVREMEAERSGKGSFLEQERDAALADNMSLKANCRELEGELKTVQQNLLEQSVQHTKVLADHDAEREETTGGHHRGDSTVGQYMVPSEADMTHGTITSRAAESTPGTVKR